ncbi:endolytic transglycosylase MltG [Streptomyces lichenis]|uniref:Endolytic murein transglycosylase n=1 Tax=Streptomyces lichenis TaxID=2306967 RepID=A0ABT0IBA9_9ACTN|nr:endolytic transglycosylase MltG [Streptomyces lichenis]MCK8678612.1 endolytic transglycosylase MltG [Streptomyces lichenis]
MWNTSPQNGQRRRVRMTRRGVLVLIGGLAVAVATAVLVPLVLLKQAPAPEKPRMLVIPEGWRAGQVYTAVDKALAVPAGTTRGAAARARLKLPPAARGNPEGFLFPATYPVTSTSTPESLLRYMVTTADRRLGAGGTTAGSPDTSAGGPTGGLYEAVTIASIVQAEADTAADMGKVARVVRNRLAQGMALQMDSTLNYALDRNTVDTTHEDTRIENPYNTYNRPGLPPTPIANPGEEAMRAATRPTPGDWLYFVSVAPGDTRFTADYQEHLANVEEFNTRRRTTTG